MSWEDDEPQGAFRHNTCQGQAAILLYHRVAQPETDLHRLAIDPRDFRRQMAHLRDEYHVVPLDELVAAVRHQRVPNGAVAVTFDDGYVDNYVTALPILDDVGVPATFFVTTHRLYDDYEHWWDALERILIASGPPLPSVLQLDLPEGWRSFETETRKQRLAAHWVIHRAIVDCVGQVRDDLMAALTEWSGRRFSRGSDHRRMRADEMILLSRRPKCVVASHSVRHLMLPGQSIEAQEIEIKESRTDLERLLGRGATAFAYPFGATADRTRELVKRSFDLAVTCEDAPVTERSDPWLLPRLEVCPDRSSIFEEWLRGYIRSA